MHDIEQIALEEQEICDAYTDRDQLVVLMRKDWIVIGTKKPYFTRPELRNLTIRGH